MSAPVRLAVAASIAAVSAFATAQAQPGPITGIIKVADGSTIGSATLSDGPIGVLMRVDIIKGLAPGFHGMHFHEKGDCSDPKFMSTGGHLNMSGMKMSHGLLNPQGPDLGDLPNLYVAADGSAHVEVLAPLVSLHGAGGRAVLADANSTALVIHANADDQISQPIGGAGPRVACAVIR